MCPSVENVLEHQSCSDGLKLEKVIMKSSVKHIELTYDLFNCVNEGLQRKNVISHKHFTCLPVLDSDWVSHWSDISVLA